MARIPLITEKSDDFTPAQHEVYDSVVRTRGKMIRPYEVLLHAPGIAKPMAELGAKIRYESSLSDHDRELVIMTAGAIAGCQFEWDSHEPIARAAGVRGEVLDHVRDGTPVDLTDREEALVSFVKQLTSHATVSQPTFDDARDALGEAGVVELAATIGYYTMLAYIMGACDAC